MKIYSERLGGVGTVYGLAIWIDSSSPIGRRIVYYVKMKRHSGLIAISSDEAKVEDERVSNMRMLIAPPPDSVVCFYWDGFSDFEAFSSVLQGDWEQESIFETLLPEEDKTT